MIEILDMSKTSNTASQLKCISSNEESFKLYYESILLVTLKRLLSAEKIFQAANYVLSVGKRVRPKLSAYYYLELGGDKLIDYIPVCLAIEFLHNASLIHDDLPALDNDTIRRGRNTCHVEFGEDTATLLGDILVPLSFELISKLDFKADVRSEMIGQLSRSYTDLCLGQQLDIQSKLDRKTQDLIKIAIFKTGALFRATFMLPAIVLELPKEVITLSGEIGVQFGIIFQICDDFLDQYSLVKKGRSESSDKRNVKETFFSKGIKKESIDFLKLNINELEGNLKKIKSILGCTSNEFAGTRRILNQVLSELRENNLII